MIPVDLAFEDDTRAVPRPDRFEVGLRSGDDGGLDARHRVGGVDVAARGVGHAAGSGEPEWRRHLTLRTGEQHGPDDEGDEQEDGHAHDPQWESRRRGRPRRDGRHGEPPFGEGPGRPLPHAGGPLDDDVSIFGRRRLGDLCQKVRQVLVEMSFGGHAGCPSTTGEAVAMGSRRTATFIAASA